jgi:hypothetical protein
MPANMLLIDSNTKRREQLAMVFRSAGCAVLAVGRIADVERWPRGEAVVTEAASFTPLWTDVGATHVIVLAESPAQGFKACNSGATAWVPAGCAPHVVLSQLRRLGICQPGALRTVNTTPAA